MVWPRDREFLPSAADPLKTYGGGVRMRTRMRWIVAVVVVLHGLIHLLGAAKGLGWADVTQLESPISTAMGVAWLAAAALVVVSGTLLSVPVRWWWVVGAVAALVSQGVILTAWSDAKAGTVANVILLAAVAYGYASQGPRSYRAEYRRRVDLVGSGPRAIVRRRRDRLRRGHRCSAPARSEARHLRRSHRGRFRGAVCLADARRTAERRSTGKWSADHGRHCAGPYRRDASRWHGSGCCPGDGGRRSRLSEK